MFGLELLDTRPLADAKGRLVGKTVKAVFIDGLETWFKYTDGSVLWLYVTNEGCLDGVFGEPYVEG